MEARWPQRPWMIVTDQERHDNGYTSRFGHGPLMGRAMIGMIQDADKLQHPPGDQCRNDGETASKQDMDIKF